MLEPYHCRMTVASVGYGVAFGPSWAILFHVVSHCAVRIIPRRPSHEHSIARQFSPPSPALTCPYDPNSFQLHRHTLGHHPVSEWNAHSVPHKRRGVSGSDDEQMSSMCSCEDTGDMCVGACMYNVSGGSSSSE